jgi:KamA family protein
VLLDVRELDHLGDVEIDSLKDVTETFAFRANDYYAGLINWNDPHDPIRRLIVPSAAELSGSGQLDPSNEAANTQLRGLQHKYPDTALLLVTDQCAAFCRYCFRKRLFDSNSREANRSVGKGIEYIASHPEITDVLLTGGDPLTLPISRLVEIVDAVSAVPHVRTIRIGSKLPAFNPYRILDDAALISLVRKQALRGKRLYFMCHFDHPRELTPAAVAAVRLLHENGAVCVNQCPVSAGINDDVDVLTELLQRCTEAGCPQYYMFQCRPTMGNSTFSVPITRGFEMFSQARSRVSGLSRRARFCMSHASGKVEIVGLDDKLVYARYHRAKNPADENRMLLLKRDDEARWLDDLAPAV